MGLKKIIKYTFVLMLSVTLLNCSSEEEIERNDNSIIPSFSLGRDNEVLGTVNLSSRNIKISVWDSGALIDGDIVSVYVNGRLVIDEVTLKSPSEKFEISTTLDYNGYNYILLYAHNEGTSPPNTAAISIDDGVSVEDFTLTSDLNTNGTVNLIIN